MKTKALILLPSYFFLILVGPAIFLLLGSSLAELPMAIMACMAIMLVIALLLYKDIIKENWLRLKKEENLVKFFLICLLGFVLVALVRTVLLSALSDHINFESLGQNQQAVQEITNSIPWYGSFFMLVIFAPIVEELVFREALIGVVDKDNKWLLVLMTILSIFLFTGAHMTTLADAILYLPLTLLIIYFYWRYHRNVAASIGFHMFNNLIAWLVMTFLPNLADF